mgnify:CR=1 FL=1
MAKGKGGGTVGTVEALVTPVLEQLGMRLWDVRFEKEGPDWFLRIYIDRDEPLDLNACEEAGLGRKLTRDVHFEAMRGRRVAAHLIRATAAGEKDVAGILQGKDGARVTLLLDDGSETVIEEKEASYFKLCDDEDLF